jgi:hypothetical protein
MTRDDQARSCPVPGQAAFFAASQRLFSGRENEVSRPHDGIGGRHVHRFAGR